MVVNAFVTYVYAGQVWQVYQDPVNAYLGFCETRGVVAIFALHIYHIVMFRPLAMVDWVHHIVMVGSLATDIRRLDVNAFSVSIACDFAL